MKLEALAVTALVVLALLVGAGAATDSHEADETDALATSPPQLTSPPDAQATQPPDVEATSPPVDAASETSPPVAPAPETSPPVAPAPETSPPSAD